MTDTIEDVAIEGMLERVEKAELYGEQMDERCEKLEGCLAATARQRDKAVKAMCDKIAEKIELKERVQFLENQLEASNKCLLEYRRAEG